MSGERVCVLSEYNRKSSAKSLIVYHLILVVKYRKPLLKKYGGQIKDYFYQGAHDPDFDIDELEIDRDHIHLMVNSCPKLSPSQIVRRLKSRSTKMIWHDHPELDEHFWKKKIFWSSGYFCSSLGNASIATINRYIETQG